MDHVIEECQLAVLEKGMPEINLTKKRIVLNNRKS